MGEAGDWEKRWRECGSPLPLLPLLLVVVIWSFAGVPHSATAELLARQSFEAPYMDFDHKGNRQIPYWQTEGSTAIKQSFVRLTADKDEEYGALWSRIPTENLKEFSVAVKIRASGKTSAEWGRHAGVFFTHNPASMHAGPLFGVPGDFIGLGVVLHRAMAPQPEGVTMQHFYSMQQLSLVANDGRLRTQTDLLKDAQFCNVRARFLETRDDFSVLECSLLRLAFKEGAVTLEVDERNTGEWRFCATLPPEKTYSHMWLQGMRPGIVAETGQLRDNHDLLSFRMWDNASEAMEWTPGYMKDGKLDGETRYAALMHHLEHELFEVQSRLQVSLEKLEIKTESDMDRLFQLEEKLGEQMVVTLEQRIMDVEARLHRHAIPEAHTKITQLEQKMLTSMKEKSDDEVTRASKAYRFPFMLLAVLLLGAGGFGYRQLAKIEQHSVY